MKKKTKITSPTDQPASLSINQRDVLFSALLCIGLIVGAFYWVVDVEQPRALDQRISTVTAASADQQRLILRSVIEQFSARVNAQADRPALAAAASAGRTEAGRTEAGRTEIEPLERSLQDAFPEARQAGLILLGDQGIADEQSETDRLRNHIEIDMLRKTLESGQLVIEAYQHQQQWLISFARLVSPQVVVFVSLPASHFQSVLSSLTGESVSHQLIQRYKNRRDVVIAASNTQYQQYMESRPLPVPGWTLEVFPQPNMVQNLRVDSTLLWLVCVLCVALISATHAVFFLRFAKTGTGSTRKTAAGNISPTANPASAPPASPVSKAAAAKTQAIAKPGSAADHNPPPLPELEENDDQPRALNCFRAYDIRGVADSELGNAHCKFIGQAIGSEAIARGQTKLLLGRDGRLSSPRIRDALLEGLLSTGLNVIDMGLLATPMLHFASRALNVGNAVMITGSHNPGHCNGMKISLEFNTLAADDIQALQRRIVRRDFHQGEGSLGQDDIAQRYIERVAGDVVIAHPLKLVIDAGNGATATIAPALFEELGCEVIPLFCEVDGHFPNHPPDPTISANLSALREAVAHHQADLGLAFDGDGDRVAVVTASGACPSADQLLMVLAEDMVSRHPGAEIIFDVKCSRLLQKLVVERGGRPTMWKCGHAFMKQKMLETGALLGGEFSGHIFYQERWYGFDDGMYSAARLLEVLTLGNQTMDQALAAQGSMVSTGEILIEVNDQDKFQLIERFVQLQPFHEASLTTLDGLRVEFRHGWGLIRASNTGAAITLRFEADSEAALQGIRDRFREVLAEIDPRLADGL